MVVLVSSCGAVVLPGWCGAPQATAGGVLLGGCCAPLATAGGEATSMCCPGIPYLCLVKGQLPMRIVVAFR